MKLTGKNNWLCEVEWCFPCWVVIIQGHSIIVCNELISKTVYHHYLETVSVYSIYCCCQQKPFQGLRKTGLITTHFLTFSLFFICFHKRKNDWILLTKDNNSSKTWKLPLLEFKGYCRMTIFERQRAADIKELFHFCTKKILFFFFMLNF